MLQNAVNGIVMNKGACSHFWPKGAKQARPRLGQRVPSRPSHLSAKQCHIGLAGPHGVPGRGGAI
jgi:hypothetical protein